MVGPRNSHVTILLSTFDGGAWLLELLDSIAAQTHTDWSLVVRDDGSTDDTVEILTRAAADDPRISVVDDDRGNLGPAASFLALLDHVDDGLFAFCDQDDVWLADKLERSIAALGRPDAEHHEIAAVYTDATLVDAAGRELGSDFEMRGVPADLPFGQLLINNAAIGATIVGTAALARRAIEIAADRPVFMHDWWVALVAGHQGSLTQLRVPTLRWRRHDDNVTGTTPPTTAARAARRRRYLAWSIEAAQWLDQPAIAATAVDDRVGRAVHSLATITPMPTIDDPTRSQRLSWVRNLAFAWRTAGVRAWPRRANAGLWAAIASQNHQN